jgi:hypothetical protein
MFTVRSILSVWSTSGSVLARLNLWRQLVNGSVFKSAMDTAAAAFFASCFFIFAAPAVSTQPAHMHNSITAYKSASYVVQYTDSCIATGGY